MAMELSIAAMETTITGLDPPIAMGEHRQTEAGLWTKFRHPLCPALEWSQIVLMRIGGESFRPGASTNTIRVRDAKSTRRSCLAGKTRRGLDRPDPEGISYRSSGNILVNCLFGSMTAAGKTPAEIAQGCFQRASADMRGFSVVVNLQGGAVRLTSCSVIRIFDTPQ